MPKLISTDSFNELINAIDHGEQSVASESLLVVAMLLERFQRGQAYSNELGDDYYSSLIGDNYGRCEISDEQYVVLITKLCNWIESRSDLAQDVTFACNHARDQKCLDPLLQFIEKHFNDPKFKWAVCNALNALIGSSSSSTRHVNAIKRIASLVLDSSSSDIVEAGTNVIETLRKPSP